MTFNELVVTQWGDTIKLSGSVDELGNWDPNKAVPLSASAYTQSNPLWQTTVTLQPGAAVRYKCPSIPSS